MKTFALFISLCFIGLQGVALADSCPTIDLNAGSNSPFSQIPIYDQGRTGICYAFASAQMIDYYRIKKGDKAYGLTNPIYASWATYYKDRPFLKATSLDYGRSHGVVASLKNVGTCSEKEVQQKLSYFKKDAKISDADVLFFLDSLYKFFEDERTDLLLNNLKSAGPELCRSANDLQKQLQKSGLFGIAPTMVLEKIFQGCKGHKVNVPDMDNYTVGSDERMNGPIKASLNKKLPAQINVCTGFFNQAGYKGLYGALPPWPRNVIGNMKADCFLHAVIVSAQKKIKGECHYLLRNSYGSYWNPTGATSCACITRDGKYKAECKRGEGAEYVGCWFKEKTIVSNTVGVNVFE